MPHLLTIIKYEFVIVKHILAFLCTVAAVVGPFHCPARGGTAWRHTAIVSARTRVRSSLFTGFARYASIPACRHFSRSPDKACAVRPMIGMCPPRSFSFSRIAAEIGRAHV